MFKLFPFFHQHDAMDCGPTCLKMIAQYHGRTFSLEKLRELCRISKEGVSMLGISMAAESLGFKTLGVHINFHQLKDEVPMPCIVHWKQNHFVVVYRIKRGKVYVADPAHGLIKYDRKEFLSCWISTRNDDRPEGIALLLEPQPDFFKSDGETLDKTKFSFVLQYLKPYRKLVFQLLLGMLLGTLLQLIFPFLTQGIVDYGIGTNNLNFVTTILIAQLTLYAAQTSVDFLRSWILLHISTRINISIISDFLIKLMKLPIGFFDTKMIGDLLQRIGDHHRIESFLTSSTLNTIFSFISLIVFICVLAFYNLKILMIFLIASAIYVMWIILFLKKRKEIDYKRFNQASAEHSNLIQLINGMQEIKLNNCEKQKRWEWENIQAKLFKVSIKGLALSQYQQSGAFFINETKNILVSFISARAVIEGDMSLGMMMAVQYIIGQLNAPIGQMIGFIQSAQDAKISLERLGEIHNKKDETQNESVSTFKLPDDKTISIDNLSFGYDSINELVLKDINLKISEGKVTALVGMSGSGKTTLIKLLLGFYPPTDGTIKIGDVDINNIEPSVWREKCGTVMQDGFIFSDTIARNMALNDENIDEGRLLYAARIANIMDMINALPLGFNTKIGQEGKGISQGQRQRILIARAVYKNPEYIFLDEATNSLDANNESIIMRNLQEFFRGKTVVVVAHRLSTVKNADNIVVLNNGDIVESGTHDELVKKHGRYYNLIKNQLELGK
ncbi:MAG: peptidase domain-containing ABC transporter [Bacteroidales bacterium]|nr:peptidase domain-containing ABC transporter [Bacteroidales bacterium]